MTDQTKNAMKQLASSSYWKIVRDEYIISEMQKINSIYDAKDYIEKARTDYELRAEILACIRAFGKVETIITKIDSYDRGNKENPISYE